MNREAFTLAEITVKLEAPELSHALLELASVLAMAISAEAGKFQLRQEAKIISAAPVESLPAYATPMAPAPAAVPVAAPTPAPAYTPAPAPTVPTASPTYTMEQLAIAATQLVDTGRQGELIQLLGQFGAAALTQLPREQYGNFATQLRAMGARI